MANEKADPVAGQDDERPAKLLNKVLNRARLQLQQTLSADPNFSAAGQEQQVLESLNMQLCIIAERMHRNDLIEHLVYFALAVAEDYVPEIIHDAQNPETRDVKTMN
jgi:hypothetical protein